MLTIKYANLCEWKFIDAHSKHEHGEAGVCFRYYPARFGKAKPTRKVPVSGAAPGLGVGIITRFRIILPAKSTAPVLPF